jgi:hypothetical protein
MAPVARADDAAMTVESARNLFIEAVADEDERHKPAIALEKFRRVLAFHDHVNVRYRIARCLEETKQHADAVVMFESTIALAGTDPKNADIVESSRTHLAMLEKQVARVSLVLSPRAPADIEVSVDDKPIAKDALRDPIVLEPGAHTFGATAKDVPPFTKTATLSAGAHVSFPIPLEAPPPHNPTTTTTTTSTSSTNGDRGTKGTSHTAQIVAIAAGGALVAGAGVVLFLRANAISDLNQSCPGGVCPASRESELSSERSRALFEGPLAVGMAAAGVVVAGLGFYFWSSSTKAPATTGQSATTAVRPLPVLLHQGAMLGVLGSF